MLITNKERNACIAISLNKSQTLCKSPIRPPIFIRAETTDIPAIKNDVEHSLSNELMKLNLVKRNAINKEIYVHGVAAYGRERNARTD